MLNKKNAITNVKSREIGAATRTDAIGWKISFTHDSTLGRSIKSGPKIRRKERMAQMLVK
jgi:hypothetical protein